jgi:hypothetical protein
VSNTPTFYVDEVMYFLSSEEFKLLMYLTHRIVGEEIPFERDQVANLTIDQIKKGTGLPGPVANEGLMELAKYRLITTNGFPSDGIVTWSLCPLDLVDLNGLAIRKKARKS